MKRINFDEIREYINKYDLCSGCGICESLFGSEAIELSENNKGFYRPIFKDNFVPTQDELNSFVYICPSLNMKSYDDRNSQLFGNIVQSKVGWSTEKNLRFKASSGGCVSSFLIYLLENHHVDGVIHITRNDTDPLHCVASVSRSRDEIINNCGSLYMPAKLLCNLNSIVKENEKYAFVGKGCDIKALRRYNEIQDNRIHVNYYIGIMCGGTPSYRGLEKIFKENDVQIEDVSYLRFRGNGWPGNFKVISSKEKEITLTYNKVWGQYLGPTSGVTCKICFDGIAEEADITFGDAWYCDESNFPSFEEADGRNLILIRTEIGKLAIDGAIKKGYIKTENKVITIQDITRMQPSQYGRRCLAKYKIIGVRIIGYKYPVIRWKQLEILRKKMRLSLYRKIRTILGMIKRANEGRC